MSQFRSMSFTDVCEKKSRRKRKAEYLPMVMTNATLLENPSTLRKVREAEESAEELELRSYGSRLRYQCGLARKVLDPETGKHYDERWMTCNWNSTWTLYDSLDTCEWVACLYPPEPPEEALLALQWDGQPTEFEGNVSYTCKDENLYFEIDKDMPEYNVTCLDDGTWDEPTEWPVCFNCESHIYHFISKSFDSGQLLPPPGEGSRRHLGVERELQLRN